MGSIFIPQTTGTSYPGLGFIMSISTYTSALQSVMNLVWGETQTDLTSQAFNHMVKRLEETYSDINEEMAPRYDYPNPYELEPAPIRKGNAKAKRTMIRKRGRI